MAYIIAVNVRNNRLRQRSCADIERRRFLPRVEVHVSVKIQTQMLTATAMLNIIRV